MKRRTLLAAPIVLCFAISLLAQGTLRLPPIKIGPLKARDTIMVRVMEPAPLNLGAFNVVTSVVIRDDGRINLPLVGDVQAAGLTVPDLQGLVEARYRNYFSQQIWPCCQIPTPNVMVQFVR